MKLFEGKSPAERNKIIAAGVLGIMALFSLYLAFGGSIFSRKTSVTVTASPTPKRETTPAGTDESKNLPPISEQNFTYETTPVVYNPASAYAPDAGRNIFAFYEPPPPCRDCPPPSPPPVVIKTPPPTPPPPMTIVAVSPQAVYAGQKGFRLEILGEKFTPETRIYFNMSEVPTTVSGSDKVYADIPAALIAAEGPRTIILQTPDGKLYSNQMMLTVQPQPKPDFKYIGMVARKSHNNDTAYFLENGKTTQTSARLTDVVGGRFRVVSISTAEAVVEDVNLGFRHRIPLERPEPGTQVGAGTGGGRLNRGFPGEGTYIPYNPGVSVPAPQPQPQPQQPPVQQQVPVQDNIPGIPNNIPRYVPPNANQARPPEKRDDDRDDDGEPPR